MTYKEMHRTLEEVDGNCLVSDFVSYTSNIPYEFEVKIAEWGLHI